MFYPVTGTYKERIFLCKIADIKRCASDNIPSTRLLKRNKIRQCQLNYDGSRRDLHSRRSSSLKAERLIKSGHIRMSRCKTKHIYIVLMLGMLADDLLRSGILKLCAIFQIRSGLAAIINRDLFYYLLRCCGNFMHVRNSLFQFFHQFGITDHLRAVMYDQCTIGRNCFHHAFNWRFF